MKTLLIAASVECAVRRPEDTAALVQIGAQRIGAGAGTGAVADGLAGYIDHTLLKPEAARAINEVGRRSPCSSVRNRVRKFRKCTPHDPVVTR